MTISYKCRSCRHQMAEFAQMPPEIENAIFALTPEERQTMIHEDGNGNIEVLLLCEYCQEALHHHPELSLLSSPLQ